MKRFLPLALVLLIASCASNETSDSDNVKQSEIYQNYSVIWTKNSAMVTASFQFGGENGTTLRLQKPASVTFNGKPLEASKFLFGGVYYSMEQTSYTTEHTFRYTDTDGKVYENGVNFEAIEFENVPKSVDAKKDLELDLSRPVSSADQIMFKAEGDTSEYNETVIGMDKRSDVYYDEAKKKLVVKPVFFSKLSDVPVSIWMDKDVYKKPLDQPTNLGGQMSFTFQSGIVEIKRK